MTMAKVTRLARLPFVRVVVVTTADTGAPAKLMQTSAQLPFVNNPPTSLAPAALHRSCVDLRPSSPEFRDDPPTHRSDRQAEWIDRRPIMTDVCPCLYVCIWFSLILGSANAYITKSLYFGSCPATVSRFYLQSRSPEQCGVELSVCGNWNKHLNAATALAPPTSMDREVISTVYDSEHYKFITVV